MDSVEAAGFVVSHYCIQTQETQDWYLVIFEKRQFVLALTSLDS
jgi:hypothetical protein